MNEALVEISNGVAPVELPGQRQESGVGYVILSRTLDRSVYVGNCLRSSVVDIVLVSGEIITNCYVGKSVWNDIQFPETLLNRGSAVVWVNIPYLNKAVVITALNKKDEMLLINGENISILGKQLPSGAAEVRTDPNNGKILISSNSDKENAGLFINILNQNLLGTLQAYIQGGVKIDLEKNLVLNTKGGFRLVYADTDVSATLEYVTGVGYNIIDEFGNAISINANGMEIDDCNGNSIYTSEDGVEIDDVNGNEIAMTSDGVNILVPQGSTITQAAYDPENPTTPPVTSTAVLAEATIEVFNSVIDGLTGICELIAGLGIIAGGTAGIADPATIAAATQLQTQIQTISDSLDTIKSLNNKLT